MRRLLATTAAAALIVAGASACTGGITYAECAEAYGLYRDATDASFQGSLRVQHVVHDEYDAPYLSERCREAIEDEVLRLQKTLDS